LVLLLTMCSCSKSPEHAGTEIGEKRCECLTVRWESDDQCLAEVLEAVKKDPSMSQQARGAMLNDLKKAKEMDSNQRYSACNKEFESMRDKIKLDFPAQDDRETIENMYRALEEQCTKEHAKTQEAVAKEWMRATQ